MSESYKDSKAVPYPLVRNKQLRDIIKDHLIAYIEKETKPDKAASDALRRDLDERIFVAGNTLVIRFDQEKNGEFTPYINEHPKGTLARALGMLNYDAKEVNTFRRDRDVAYLEAITIDLTKVTPKDAAKLKINADPQIEKEAWEDAMAQKEMVINYLSKLFARCNPQGITDNPNIYDPFMAPGGRNLNKEDSLRQEWLISIAMKQNHFKPFIFDFGAKYWALDLMKFIPYIVQYQPEEVRQQKIQMIQTAVHIQNIIEEKPEEGEKVSFDGKSLEIFYKPEKFEKLFENIPAENIKEQKDLDDGRRKLTIDLTFNTEKIYRIWFPKAPESPFPFTMFATSTQSSEPSSGAGDTKKNMPGTT